MQRGEQIGLQQGMQQELLPAIELGLELKFGNEGLQLLPEIAQIQDVEQLRAIREGIRRLNSLEELRQIYA